MCGIAGYFGTGTEEIVQRMTRSLRHRGPDDEGFFVNHEVGLGHRRLSIIDLSPSGHQPMSNEDGTIWIVFNGEIYNFHELRARLSSGHQLKGKSDTEVIVHLYEEVGEEVFSLLNGMFAIAIYDQKKGRITIAHDRMGKKPLYYSIVGETIVFGSELKAVLCHPAVKRTLSLPSLNQYVQYEYVPTPATIFENIYKLEPGSFLSFTGKIETQKQFWQMSFVPQSTLSITDAATELDHILDDAVKIRLESDVPLGVFLSGGIDSSAIAYYAQKNSAQKIQTFSIGFSEQSFDELPYARLVSKHLGTDHHEQTLSAEDSLGLIPHIADLMDEPLADASIIPTYLLSQFTRKHVTVALGGDGGDELFGGYDTFVAERAAGLYGAMPASLRTALESALLTLPTSFRNISTDFKIKKFIRGYSEDDVKRHVQWLGSFDRSQRSQLFTPEVWNVISKKDEFAQIDTFLNRLNVRSHERLLALYLRTYLLDDILVKVDRASMFNSLEVRAPLLDYRLVDFVNRLPFDYKVHGRTTKYLFKKMMADKLPREIVYRKKKGFGVPLADWLTNELKPLVLEVLSEEDIKKQGLFNYQYIQTLVNEHFSRRADHRKLIWTLVVFQLWHKKWNTVY